MQKSGALSKQAHETLGVFMMHLLVEVHQEPEQENLPSRIRREFVADSSVSQGNYLRTSSVDSAQRTVAFS
jgi:hypothetical protein